MNKSNQDKMKNNQNQINNWRGKKLAKNYEIKIGIENFFKSVFYIHETIEF